MLEDLEDLEAYAHVRILGPGGYPKSLQLVDPMVVLKLGQLVHIPQATRHKMHKVQ